jgi:hypothetical protein
VIAAKGAERSASWRRRRSLPSTCASSIRTQASARSQTERSSASVVAPPWTARWSRPSRTKSSLTDAGAAPGRLTYGRQSGGSCRNRAGSASTTRMISSLSSTKAPSSSRCPAGTADPSCLSECAYWVAFRHASASESAETGTEISARYDRPLNNPILNASPELFEISRTLDPSRSLGRVWCRSS